MPDRENVLKTLETCVRDDNLCDGCPLYGADGWCESEEMVEIPKNYVKLAIVLLKAQEARVMTLDEARSSYVIEYRSGNMREVGASILDIDVDPTNAYYDEIYRVWTSRPTKEQREAVKWE